MEVKEVRIRGPIIPLDDEGEYTASIGIVGEEFDIDDNLRCSLEKQLGLRFLCACSQFIVLDTREFGDADESWCLIFDFDYHPPTIRTLPKPREKELSPLVREAFLVAFGGGRGR